MKKKRKLMLITLIVIIFLTSCNKIESIFQLSKDNMKSSEDELNTLEKYLLNNYSIINFEDEVEFEDLSILDSDLEGKEIFFTGEYHGIKANTNLRMKFLKYFKEKTDFKYYLCELSYSDAYFLNKYLDTGDIKILEELYKPLKGTFEWNKDNYNHWKKLYEYNKTLPIDKRIQVVGVDIEHQIENAYRYLVDVLPNKEVPEEIKEKIKEIKRIFNDQNNFYNGVAVKYSKELLDDIEEKENIYKEYLGEAFNGFKLVNLNVLNTNEAYKNNGNNENWNNTRDKMIYENFKIVESELPKGKYYGQWGLNHAFQSKEGNIMWFGAYLNSEESIYKDKILTIAYYYDDCEQMVKKNNGRYFVSKMNIISPTIKKINDLIESNVNIYKLTGEGSPFYEMPMNNTFTGKELEESVVDFFQYIVCIKNSKATEPLNDEYN